MPGFLSRDLLKLGQMLSEEMTVSDVINKRIVVNTCVLNDVSIVLYLFN